MGLPPSEALKRLKLGDYSFVCARPLDELAEISRLDASAAFYVGLKVYSSSCPDAQVRGDILMQTALSSPSLLVRREAFSTLLSSLLRVPEGLDAPDTSRLKQARDIAAGLHEKQPGEALYRAGLARTMVLSGDRAALAALYSGIAEADLIDAERFPFLLSRKDPMPGLSSWFLNKNFEQDDYERFRRAGSFLGKEFGTAETVAFRARETVAARSYAEASVLFKGLLVLNRALVLSSASLVGEMGKAFQYGLPEKEGMALLTSIAGDLVKDGKGETRDSLYRALFYIARIQLRQGEKAASEKSFREALNCAPDSAQADACRWYLLDAAVERSPSEAVELIKEQYPSWADRDSFDDLVEGLDAQLVAEKAWALLFELWKTTSTKEGGLSHARHAYIASRLLELGFVTETQVSFLLPPTQTKDGAVRDLLRAAFESDRSSLYYRALAASRLGEKLEPAASRKPVQEEPKAEAKKVDEGMPDRDFLLGFFKYGNAEAAMPYAVKAQLSPEDTRTIASAFAAAGRWGDSIRYAAQLQWRPSYQLTREDLALIYPRAFSGEIEEASSRWGLLPELFFGLVRTESAFIPDVRSSVGAVGLSQLMPSTAMDVVRRMGSEASLSFVGDSPDLTDPATNTLVGAWYLADQSKRLESSLLALLAYNGGPARVRRWRALSPELPEDLFLEGVPIAETRNYGKKVLSASVIYGYLYYARAPEKVIPTILSRAQ